MSVTEIVLIIIGGIILIAGYLLPKKKDNENQTAPAISEETIKEMVSQEVERAKSRIHDVVDETINYSMEKTERAMERLSNEKIMSVNEYSDTVLESIHKNHESVIFLYDMLNEKHDHLVQTVGEAQKLTSTLKAEEETAQEERKSKRTSQASKTKSSQEEGQTKKAGTKNAGKKKAETAESSKTNEEETAAADAFQPIAPPRISEDELLGDHPVNVLEMIERQEELAREQDLPEVDIQFAGESGNNNDKILVLHKEGKSNTAIAKELGLGVGEVKLVIDLFQSM